MKLAIASAVALAACTPAKPAVTGGKIVVSTTDAPVAPVSPLGLVPPEPKLRLPRNFVPSEYRVSLAIDPAKAGFTGSIEIAGAVAERSSTIWLHGRKLAIARAVASSGDPFDSRHAHDVQLVATAHGEDLLELRAASPLDAGTWTLTIDFAADYELLNTAGAFKQTVGKETYVYSQFEAIYARRVFPCLDEPDVKVPWRLALEVPKDLVAVANTPIVKSEPFGDDGKRKRVEFAPTKPLPSYLLAFGVGPFETVDAGATTGGTPIHILALKGRAADAAWAAKTAPKILELEEDFFGMPYPYAKLDFLAIPVTVGFSAMENAGLITFSERDMLLDAKASKEREHRWIYVAAHEIAHQWFGDLVTMAWWDDLWLNEGFANWLEHQISAKFDPRWHDELAEVGRHHSALDDDALVSARKIRQPIDAVDDILGAFDGITYDKGSSILDMFESYVGRDRFRDGVRAYLKSKQHGNATSADFAAAISKVAGKDVAPAFATFLDQAGEPEITARLDCTHPSSLRVVLEQRRYLPPGAPPPENTRPWILPVCVHYESAGKSRQDCTLMAEPSATIALAGDKCPAWMVTNADGRGYYHSAYTAAQLTALRDVAWDKLAWNERLSIAYEARTYAGTAKLPLALAMSFVPKLLAGNDRFTIAEAVELPQHVSDAVPDDLRPKYEQWLRQTFGPGADQVGLVSRPTDELDAEASRGDLIRTVGRYGRAPKILEEATRLAADWRALPQGVRPIVLELATDAKPELFERLIKDIYTEADRTRRREMFIALARVRDPKRQVAALGLVLDDKLDIRETLGMLDDATTEANRRVAQQFFRDHTAAIMKRIPADGTADSIGAELAALFTGSCDATRRDETAAYVLATFGKLPAGDRAVRQAIEEMDQCIAGRKLVEPELRGWLGGMKLVKPAAPTPIKPATPVKTTRPHRP